MVRIINHSAAESEKAIYFPGLRADLLPNQPILAFQLRLANSAAFPAQKSSLNFMRSS
jgi:hypothetical protein